MSALTFCLWLVLVWGSGWLFFPLARRIFGDLLADGGLAVGRVLFLTAWTLTAFWIGQFGVSTRVSSFLWLGLAAIGIAVGLRDQQALKAEFGMRKRAFICSDTIFLVVFLGFFFTRGFWSDTDGTNGEKSMDSALIGSISRAQKLPPPNPYAAGATMRGYYYFGHLETALLTDATGTTVRWSYNLMCATIPALCISTLFALGAGMTGRLLGGGFVSGAVLGLGTLEPLIQWRTGTFGSSTPFRLDFFATSRVIPFSINEYPWFTFNQADLHAHYFDFTFALATLCLAYAIYRGRRTALVPAALVLGAQVLTNTWDYPAYGLVLGLATLGATGILKRQPKEAAEAETEPKSAIWPRVSLAFYLVMSALVVAAPYLLKLQTAANPPRPLPQPASPLREWLMLWGPFVAVWLSFLSYTLFKTRWQRVVVLVGCALVLLIASRSSWFVPNIPFEQAYHPSHLVVPLILICLGLAIWGALTLLELPRFLCFLAIGGLMALLWSETTWAGFLGDPNSPRIVDAIRQDTVFKFGLQTWMLWGVACATGAFITLNKWPEALKCVCIVALPVMVIASLSVTFGRTHNFQLWGGQGQWIGWQDRPLGDPYFQWGGWDGWAHLKPEEKEAALWLERNTLPGQNIIEAEAAKGGDYSNYTRYAHATGIPTIIGPQAHSFQWSPADLGHEKLTRDQTVGREWDEIFRRKAAVRGFYTAADPFTKHDILTRYGVQHIVWGELERAEYGDGSLELLRSTCRQEAHFGTSNSLHQVWIFATPNP